MVKMLPDMITMRARPRRGGITARGRKRLGIIDVDVCDGRWMETSRLESL
jgi:hypothetical protein